MPRDNLKEEIRVLGNKKRDLSAKLRSVSQKLSEKLRLYFGWKDDD